MGFLKTLRLSLIFLEILISPFVIITESMASSSDPTCTPMGGVSGSITPPLLIDHKRVCYTAVEADKSQPFWSMLSLFLWGSGIESLLIKPEPPAIEIPVFPNSHKEVVLPRITFTEVEKADFLSNLSEQERIEFSRQYDRIVENRSGLMTYIQSERSFPIYLRTDKDVVHVFPVPQQHPLSHQEIDKLYQSLLGVILNVYLRLLDIDDLIKLLPQVHEVPLTASSGGDGDNNKPPLVIYDYPDLFPSLSRDDSLIDKCLKAKEDLLRILMKKRDQAARDGHRDLLHIRENRLMLIEVERQFLQEVQENPSVLDGNSALQQILIQSFLENTEEVEAFTEAQLLEVDQALLASYLQWQLSQEGEVTTGCERQRCIEQAIYSELDRRLQILEEGSDDRFLSFSQIDLHRLRNRLRPYNGRQVPGPEGEQSASHSGCTSSKGGQDVGSGSGYQVERGVAFGRPKSGAGDEPPGDGGNQCTKCDRPDCRGCREPHSVSGHSEDEVVAQEHSVGSGSLAGCGDLGGDFGYRQSRVSETSEASSDGSVFGNVGGRQRASDSLSSTVSTDSGAFKSATTKWGRSVFSRQRSFSEGDKADGSSEDRQALSHPRVRTLTENSSSSAGSANSHRSGSPFSPLLRKVASVFTFPSSPSGAGNGGTRSRHGSVDLTTLSSPFGSPRTSRRGSRVYPSSDFLGKNQTESMGQLTNNGIENSDKGRDLDSMEVVDVTIFNTDQTLQKSIVKKFKKAKDKNEVESILRSIVIVQNTQRIILVNDLENEEEVTRDQVFDRVFGGVDFSDDFLGYIQSVEAGLKQLDDNKSLLEQLRGYLITKMMESMMMDRYQLPFLQREVTTEDRRQIDTSRMHYLSDLSYERMTVTDLDQTFEKVKHIFGGKRWLKDELTRLKQLMSKYPGKIQNMSEQEVDYTSDDLLGLNKHVIRIVGILNESLLPETLRKELDGWPKSLKPLFTVGSDDPQAAGASAAP